MKREIQQRLQWVQLYEKTGDAGLVCRRCGISRPTLRKWWKRYQEHGVAGLVSQSRRPKNSPAQKVSPQAEEIILEIRRSRNLGARRIQAEIMRLHDLSLSLATIHKILIRNQVKPVLKIRKKAGFIRYERPIPGDRVQMDTCKIASGLFQYTAIDDCTRYRVLRLYSRRTAANTLDFIEHVVDEMPFPVQRVQTDRGQEFFAIKVQEKFREYGIKFRPNKPGSPHLNGKVERSQKTDQAEFYATIRLDDPELHSLLAEWQHYYNWDRPHSAHNGKTPVDRFHELIDDTPFSEEVLENFYPEKERIQEQSYQRDLAVRKLK
ncbi:IS481 family transposase [Oxalobacter vibrioformis]|uniref:IS481 family transposase n=1 Tax=Oxalobacter vibrioformis TaxID=933080 RepID=A0A9E9LVC7_9BURK|nr:IS481 family transposase [Oxalobacter vibrioformis]WAW10400.1 IS481 family transposase [Oxalobacter vibrioformis]